MAGPEEFQLRSETVASLPVINHFLTRMGLSGVLERHLPRDDARLRLAPAAVIGVVVRNLIVSHQPVYALGEWAAPYDPALLGLGPSDAAALNDDRVGRMLDRLFDADRASLITEVVLRCVREFDIEVSQLHNDSTTVTFSGAYRGATSKPRGGKPTPSITYGHNKDHRPDLLTELREESSQFRAVIVGWPLTVLAHARRPRIPGSRLVDGAVGGVVGRDRRPLRALSAA